MFRKVGINKYEWQNFESEVYDLSQKDGLIECGILCATKESCGGFIYYENTGCFTFSQQHSSNN